MTGKAEGPRTRTLVVLLLVFAALRLGLGVLPGFPPDLETSKRWAVWGALNGVHTQYDAASNYDYPPLFGYMLAPLGMIAEEVSPSYARRFLHIRRDLITQVPYSAAFSLLVKSVPLVFDILLAGLVGLLVHRHGMWPGRPDWGGWLPASLILFSPPILYISGYLGMADSIHIFFVVLALSLILLRRPELGWVAAALGCMMKPLAGPYLPLLALATLMRMGFKRSCTAALTSWATLALVFTPFLLTGRGGVAVTRILSDLELYPMTSVGGHNLWWLLAPWEAADEPFLGPLVPRTIGSLLFGGIYLGILVWVWRTELTRRRDREDQEDASATSSEGGDRSVSSSGDVYTDLYDDRHWYLAAGATGFSFFVFFTHMHENHLLLVVPLLALFAGWGRKWLWLYVVVGVSIVANMAAHDIFIGEYAFSKIGGQSEFISPTLVWYKGIEDLTRSAYLSKFELGLSYVNSVVTLGCWATFMWWMLRSTSTRSTDSGSA